MSEILVVGGAGFIGTHVCVELVEAGHGVTVLDDLSNSRIDAIDRVRRLTGAPITFVNASIGAPEGLDHHLDGIDFDAVIHLAARKSVPQSVAHPLQYYTNNLTGTLSLVDFLARRNVRRIVFSSSATVYRPDSSSPIAENAPVGPSSPYGWSKLAVEQVLRDLAGCGRGWRAVNLRYFNPVGAHPSALIGENPSQPAGNLFPIIAEVAAGLRPDLHVFGNDYATPDGTGIRDYVHVCDIARAHVAALGLLADGGDDRAWTINLGTGTGYSVMQVLAAWQEACGNPIAHAFHPRRPGDVAVAYADPTFARDLLGWTPNHDLAEMCRTHLAWRHACSTAELTLRQKPVPSEQPAFVAAAAS